MDLDKAVQPLLDLINYVIFSPSRFILQSKKVNNISKYICLYRGQKGCNYLTSVE